MQKLVHNDETGEDALWDGQTLTKLNGRIVTNEKTGEKALWDGKSLTPVKMDFDMSQPDAKEDVQRVEDIGKPAPSPETPIEEPQPKSFMQRAGQFVKEAAVPAASAFVGAKRGASVGARLGGPRGAAIGGVLGGALGTVGGEALTQKLGIKEEDPTEALASGAIDLMFPVAGRALKAVKEPVKAGLKKVVEKLPGAAAAIKQPMITRMRSLPGKFRPEVSSEQLYDELEQMGDVLIPTSETRSTLTKLAGKQRGLDPSLKDPKLLRDVKKMGETYPESGKPFSEMRAVLKGLDEDIGVAKSKGGERLHTLTQRRNALIADMDTAAEHLPALKEANAAFKSEKASDELKKMVEGAVTTLKSAPAAKGKRSVVDFNAGSMLDQFRKITNPRNPEAYDKLFAEGLGQKNIKEITEVLEKINDYGPIQLGWSGGGSLVAQQAVAGLGTGAAGAVLGGPVGGLIGGLIGASAPVVIGEALLRRPARAFLLKSLKSSQGKITNPDAFLATLGAIVQRTPALAEE